MNGARVGRAAHKGAVAARAAVLQLLLKGAGRLAGGRQVFLTSYPSAPEPRWGWGWPPNAALDDVFQRDRERFEHARGTIAPHLDYLSTIPVEGDVAALHWNNGFWGALDAAFQCASLVDRAPKRYLEVGSGYSTMFARRTIEAHGLPTTITSIDPAPRADIDALCDRVVRRPLQDVDSELFSRLDPGDMVLFDGSHEAYMAADAVVMFLELLALIPNGVLVAIDDVFLPWDYPADWASRFYGEQYLLGAYLAGGGEGTRIVLPAFFLTRGDNDHHRYDEWVPHLGSFGKSFWLERV